MQETRPDSTTQHPDYRFTLANERTFLAYIRTALALDAAGLAVAQFVRNPELTSLSVALAVLLTVLGLSVAALGYLRWRSSERALHRGEPLPALHLPLVVATGLVAVSAAVLVIAVLGQ